MEQQSQKLVPYRVATEWRYSPCTVPLSFPETLTCDVLLRCPRVGLSGAVRGTQSSAHPGRTRGKDSMREMERIIHSDRFVGDGGRDVTSDVTVVECRPVD